MISDHALTVAIDENNKQGEDDLSEKYSDIPRRTGWLLGIKRWP